MSQHFESHAPEADSPAAWVIAVAFVTAAALMIAIIGLSVALITSRV